MQGQSIFDDAVIGGGILGLSCAYQLARRGRRVVVLDRAPAERGELLLETGSLRFSDQPPGERLALALKSRKQWLDLLNAAGLWYETAGSALVMHADDEREVLHEYLRWAQEQQVPCELLHRDEALAQFPWLNHHSLSAVLRFPFDMGVDARQLATALPAFLASQYRVEFLYETGAARIESQTLHTSRTPVYARNFWVCSEADFAQLYPELFRESGLYRVRVQRLRTRPQPEGQRLGALLAGAHTLLEAPAYRGLPACSAVRARYEQERPESLQHCVEGQIGQDAAGHLFMAETRTSGPDAESPFFNGESEQQCLDAVFRVLQPPQPGISQRWFSSYWKLSEEPWYISRPAENVTICVGLGSAALTVAPGLANQLVKDRIATAQRIDLVVFNLEGTAIVDGDGAVSCLRDAFFDFGMQVPLAQIRQVLGWPKPAAIRYLIDQSPEHATRLRDQVALIHANFTTRMKRYYMHDPRVQVAPGVAELFRSLRESGVKVALNSGFNRELTQTILHRFSWRVGEQFDAAVSSDEVQRGRPFPDMVLELMKRLGVEKPRHVAKVGDSPADIEEGINAGCGLVVGIASGTHRTDDLRHYRPHHVIAKLAELPALLPREAEED